LGVWRGIRPVENITAAAAATKGFLRLAYGILAVIQTEELERLVHGNVGLVILIGAVM